MATPARDREAVEQAVVRGSELLKQGKLEDAQKQFRTALDLDHENTRVLALLGLSHFRAAQFDQARPLYEELVERAPTDASHRLNLGLVYLKLGDSDRAITSLEASRALDPSQGRAVSYLGLAYARAGRYAEAYRAFLLAGQNDLATEIEQNLAADERDAIHQQLMRSGLAPAISQTAHPAVARTVTPPAVTRTATARTQPPSNPPSSKSRAVTGEFQTIRTSDERKPEPAKVNVEASAARPPQSMPAIVIDRPPVFSSAAIPIEKFEPGAPSQEMPRISDSLQFVLPKSDAVPQASLDGQSMVSRAVAAAAPKASAVAAKVAAGSIAPLPLSQVATDDLVRPDDGDTPFEVSANGALVIRVTERVLARLDGVHVTGGDLAYEPAMRRSRGHQIEDRFDYGGAPMHTISGTGYLIAVPGDRVFTAITLDDDIFYLREDLVFAFQATLRWENGHIPGLRGRLPVVQFRGDGSVALRSGKPLVRVKLPAQGVIFIDATKLAGWIGRVIPRAVVPPSGGPMGDMCVECTGEGVVLLDPVGDPGNAKPEIVRPLERTARVSVPPPPPTTPAIAELDLDDDGDPKDEF